MHIYIHIHTCTHTYICTHIKTHTYKKFTCLQHLAEVIFEIMN